MTEQTFSEGDRVKLKNMKVTRGPNDVTPSTVRCEWSDGMAINDGADFRVEVLEKDPAT